jgi:hypothetical protein
MNDEAKYITANQLTGLWAAFFLGLIVLYFKAMAAPAPGYDASRLLIMVYELLFFSVAQTIFLVIYDLRYVSRPRKIKISVDENEALEVIQMLVRAAKASYLFRAFIVSCGVAEASGAYALVMANLGAPAMYIHIFMGLAFAGLIYVGLRMRLCWAKLWLE